MTITTHNVIHRDAEDLKPKTLCCKCSGKHGNQIKLIAAAVVSTGEQYSHLKRDYKTDYRQALTTQRETLRHAWLQELSNPYFKKEIK